MRVMSSAETEERSFGKTWLIGERLLYQVDGFLPVEAVPLFHLAIGGNPTIDHRFSHSSAPNYTSPPAVSSRKNSSRT